MPVTYSINVGTSLEAYRKPDIISVLKDIPDNTHKLISPKNVRDAFISTWASSPFKQTTNLAGIEYIGIDSGNPANRDIKQKILIGKRSFANLDIMTDSLLSNESADIYFYNTKPDSYLTQSSTKIAILAGTNSNLYQTAPYIESRVEGSSNILEIRNPSLNKGPISVYSASGRVAINGILFPTVSETSAPTGAADGRILKYSGSYPNGYLKWTDLTYDMTNVGTPGLPTNIYGSPVRLNGYSLEFVDNSVVPSSIGGVPAGFSFSSKSFYNVSGATHQNWPLSEVLRKLIYPYVRPSLSLTVINNNPLSSGYGTTYSKSGVAGSIAITYYLTIYPRTPDENVSNFLINSQSKWGTNFSQIAATVSLSPANTYSGLSFSGVPGKTFSNTFLISSVPSVNSDSGGRITYTMNLATVPGASVAGYPINIGGWSYSASASLNFIRPIYYGFSNNSNVGGDLLSPLESNLTELVRPYPGPTASMYLSINGSGYLYFAIPLFNGIGGNVTSASLKSIKDPNGFQIHSSTSMATSTFFATQSIPAAYCIFRSKNICSYTGDNNFEFIF